MKRQVRNKRELMIEAWEELDCETVGAAELETIQNVLREVYGEGATEGPAAIARVLADEGAVLRHSEVLECDVNWRQQNISVEELDFTNPRPTADRLAQLAEQWKQSNLPEQKALSDLVHVWRREAELLTSSKVIDESGKAVVREVRGWIGVWLQNPVMFADWLSLRVQAAEFVEKFGEQSTD